MITEKTAGWTTSVLDCLPMLFLMQSIIINHVLKVESIIRLGQDIILRAAFFTEILYEDFNLVWK